MNLKEKIRVIENFPIEGISFKDITTLISDGEALKETIDQFVAYLKDKKVDLIVGPEARGFIFGVPVAYALGIGFIPVRKPGKLPGETISVNYGLEYGEDQLQIHKDAIKPGQRVVVCDDLMATAGTLRASKELIENLGGKLVGAAFYIELPDLKGREKLPDVDIYSLVKYHGA